MDPVAEDPLLEGGKIPSSLRLFIDDEINGLLMIPAGVGPFPLAILCHGFPGHENNMDIAHSLVRAGVAAAVFHYRGAWGSRGNFSFSNMIKDIHRVTSEFRMDPEKFDLDPDRIVLVGHSMGGWASLMASSEDPGLRNVVSIAGFNLGLVGRLAVMSDSNMAEVKNRFEEAMPALSGCTPEGLLEDILSHGDSFDLLTMASPLRERSILMVCGERDPTSVPSLHHYPLRDTLRDLGIQDLEEVSLDADHSFLGCRVALQRAILAWVLARIS